MGLFTSLVARNYHCSPLVAKTDNCSHPKSYPLVAKTDNYRPLVGQRYNFF